MRIFVVVTASNPNRLQTLLLPSTFPPGTLAQICPSQYWTSKSRMPNCENTMPNAGSDGLAKLSCRVKTSISLIACGPAKSTCSQSGYVDGVPSDQPPPFPHPNPLRSPLIAPAGSYPAPRIDDPVANPPLTAAATFTRGRVDVVKLHQTPLSASVVPAAFFPRACQ